MIRNIFYTLALVISIPTFSLAQSSDELLDELDFGEMHIAMQDAIKQLESMMDTSWMMMDTSFFFGGFPMDKMKDGMGQSFWPIRTNGYRIYVQMDGTEHEADV